MKLNYMEEIIMALFLLITYILILILQIILLVIAIRKKKLWGMLFSIEVIPMVIAIGLTIRYNNLPGYGFMPGLSYLGEVLFSFGATILYGINFLISVCFYKSKISRK